MTVDDSDSQTVTIANPVGSDGDVEIAAIGTDDTGFSVSDLPILPTTLSPGQSVDVTVSFTPTAAGAAAGSLDVTHDGASSPLSVALTGEGTEAPTVLFVDAGDVTSPPSGWETDGAYRTGGSTASTESAIDLTHPSVPVGTPEAVFQTEAWGPHTWDFDVADGDYEVRLYFAETFGSAGTDDGRLFDVSIEGTLVLDEYDQWEEAGNALNKAVVETFLVSVDDGDGLTIDVANGGADNAAIKGVSIRAIEYAARLYRGRPAPGRLRHVRGVRARRRIRTPVPGHRFGRRAQCRVHHRDRQCLREGHRHRQDAVAGSGIGPGAAVRRLGADRAAVRLDDLHDGVPDLNDAIGVCEHLGEPGSARTLDPVRAVIAE